MVSDAIWWIEVLLLDKRHENELFSTVPCRASSAFNLSSLFCLNSCKPRYFSIPPTIPPITNDLLNVISHFCVLRYSTYLLPLYFPIHPSLFLRVNEFQYLFAVRTDSSLNLLRNTTGRTIRIQNGRDVKQRVKQDYKIQNTGHGNVGCVQPAGCKMCKTREIWNAQNINCKLVKIHVTAIGPNCILQHVKRLIILRIRKENIISSSYYFQRLFLRNSIVAIGRLCESLLRSSQ